MDPRLPWSPFKYGKKTKLKEKTIKINKIKFYIACFMNPSFPHYKPEKEALQRSLHLIL